MKGVQTPMFILRNVISGIINLKRPILDPIGISPVFSEKVEET